jgi:hypothetical protein
LWSAQSARGRSGSRPGGSAFAQGPGDGRRPLAPDRSSPVVPAKKAAEGVEEEGVEEAAAAEPAHCRR